MMVVMGVLENVGIVKFVLFIWVLGLIFGLIDIVIDVVLNFDLWLEFDVFGK